MGYNVHDVLRKILVYYTRKHKFLKNQCLVIICIVINFKGKTQNLQGINTFSKIHLCEKVFFWAKGHGVLF